MNLTFRDIVNYLKINAPVYFTPKNKLNPENYTVCQFISDDEYDAILSKKHSLDEHYSNNGIGLHFPDITITEYYKLEIERNRAAVNLYIQEISCITEVKIDEMSLVYAIFVVLHEYGHWLDFKSSGLSGYNYMLKFTEEKKDAHIIAEQIRMIPDNYLYKETLAKQYNKTIYNNMLIERPANEYAYAKIREAIKTVKSFYAGN